jgi:peptidoglycan/xylan/chitin deacetylase (PgdA/CDA1 family)
VHSASNDYEKIYASVEAYLDDFYEAWDIIYEATGVKTEIFRFPGGSKNDFNEATRDEIIEEMTRRGFRFYDWNVDSNDAGGANWSDMYNSVPEDISGNYRSIVLMHDSDTRTNTVLVLEDILNVLVGEGYKLDKISNDTRPVQFIGPYA